jgi:hypothetical protein
MTANIINFSDATPAAGGGKVNVTWQNDGGTSTVNISAEVPDPTVEIVAFTGTAGTLAHVPTKILGLFKNGQRLAVTTDYSVSGAAVTLVVAAVGSDGFIAVYYF